MHLTLPPDHPSALLRLAEISLELRKEHERAFYGDIEFIPTREYGHEDAQQALDAVRSFCRLPGG